jgi:hypothetical protein
MCVYAFQNEFKVLLWQQTRVPIKVFLMRKAYRGKNTDLF